MDSTESPPSGSIQFLAWLETNKKRLLLGGVAVIAVVCVAIVVIQAQAQRQTSAFEELSEVKIPSGLGAQPLAGAAGQYLKVAEENSGTRAAGWAVLLAGGSYFSEGKVLRRPEPVRAISQGISGQPLAKRGAPGNCFLPRCARQNQRGRGQVRRTPAPICGDAVVDEAKLALGRLYEGQGKNEDAFKLYDEVMKAGMAMQSGLAMEAGARMEDLTKRYPELARPKTPIIPTNLITQPILMTNPPMVRSTNQALALSNAMWRATSGIPTRYHQRREGHQRDHQCHVAVEQPARRHTPEVTAVAGAGIFRQVGPESARSLLSTKYEDYDYWHGLRRTGDRHLLCRSRPHRHLRR
jgi:hypothetical protein